MGTYKTMLGDASLYYEERGQGQPVVFVHGWTSNCRYFEPIISMILATGKYRVISYDQRGHGFSSVPDRGYTMQQLGKDLFEIISFLGLKDVVLVGHSMGAMAIYSYIDQFGCDNIKKCVFIDMSPKYVNDETWRWGYRQTPMEITDLISDMNRICDDFDQFMLDSFKTVFPPANDLLPAFQLLMKPGIGGSNDRKAMALFYWSMGIADYREAIKKITVPVLYFHPDFGQFPRETAFEFFANNCGSTVKIIECVNATHGVPVEQPVMIAQEIDAFIDAE